MAGDDHERDREIDLEEMARRLRDVESRVENIERRVGITYIGPEGVPTDRPASRDGERMARAN